MKVSFKYSVLIALAILIIISSINLYRSFNTPKIAYVRSGELVYQYKGMKEAQNKFQEKTKELKANLVSLREDFEKAIQKYQLEANKLTIKEKQEREQNLQKQRQQILEYEETVGNKVKMEEETMTSGVLNQVNSFVQSYAQEKGYSMVLGTTTSGNILYGEGGMDITEELIKALNEEYYGKGKATN